MNHTERHQFKRLFYATHSVSIMGGSKKTYYANERVSVGVNLEASACNDDGLSSFVYLWENVNFTVAEKVFELNNDVEFGEYILPNPKKKDLEILPWVSHFMDDFFSYHFCVFS